MTSNIFAELGIIIAVAILITAVLRMLKQPIIISYIIAGVIVGPALFNVISSTELVTTFSEIGIVILLFTVGLTLNPKIIKEVGKVALITGIGQALFTAVIGYFIALALGFSTIPALYISIAITFSSTIIITKLLSDKGDLDKLYGKIAIGFLIVQDILAILVLIAVASFSNHPTSFTNFALSTFLAGAGLVVGLFLVGHYVLPKVTKYIAKSEEFLFLFSLGWCFIVATIFNIMNLSIEVGAIMAGITLSLSPYRYEIASKMRPIRDFFIFLFFIWLGSQLTFSHVQQYLIPIIIFSLFVLIGNPISVLILMGILGYRKQTSFLAGLTVAQISEFSHILITLGIKLGHLQNDLLSLITMIGIITIGGSTYFIIYGQRIYDYLSPYLSIFERKKLRERKIKEQKKYDVILFGGHRIGHDILEAFKHKKQSLLVVDYNPDIIEKLTKKGFSCMYGDISDVDLLDEIDLCHAKMVISTVPDLEANILFMKRVKLCNPKIIILVVANAVTDALELYREGATYVITPKFIGGAHISQKIKVYQFEEKKFTKEREAHMKHLKRLKD